ncbi:quinon protein alcohol dehydrogenase-like superfamily [Pilobolus umbonatus]|nr:quinon protein alcohol dehydrogenase-like superfamily [Pilobolus umbonatus]
MSENINNTQPIKDFLNRHVPEQLKAEKLCYRHRPDLVKRRKPDDFNMENLQRQMETFPTEDRAAITHIWSIFSAAPADQRILILKGLLSTCCMPQLSFLYDAIKPLLRIDFLSILPHELSLKIFFYLDAKSLCSAAQVSHNWRNLADNDALWHRMCEQHIAKKCIKCGWGLPLLKKRAAIIPKKALIEPTPIFRRPWKEVYSERLMVERNWRNNKYTMRVLSGHTDGVMAVQFCDGGNVLMTGSYDKTVRIWNLETGELIRVLTGHTRCVRALQFDDAKLVTGSMDHTLKIWNWQTGTCIRTLEGHTGGVLSLHYNSRLMASGSTDQTIRVWNFSAGECCTLTGHTEWVNSVRFCQDESLLVSASDDSTIRLWDVTKRACIRVFDGHVGQVQVALPSPKGFLYRFTEEESPNKPTYPHTTNSSLDNTIKVWDMQTGACLRTLFGHVEGVWGIAYDNLRITSASHDKTIRIWDLGSGKCMHALEGHSGPVTAVALSDTKIISTSDDGDVRIWDYGVSH